MLQTLLNILKFLFSAILIMVPQFGIIYTKSSNLKNQIIGFTFVLIAYFLVIAILLFLFRKQKFYRKLKKNEFASILWGYFAVIILKIILLNLNNIIYHQTKTANDANIDSLLHQNTLTSLAVILMIVFFGPVCEELVYRGIFMELFWRKNPAMQVLLSGILFGLIHSSTTPISLLTYMTLGWVLAYLYRNSDNLITSTAVHFLNNLPAIFLIFTL